MRWRGICFRLSYVIFMGVQVSIFQGNKWKHKNGLLVVLLCELSVLSGTTQCICLPLHRHDSTWKRPIKVQNLKLLSLFLKLWHEKGFLSKHTALTVDCYKTRNDTVFRRICACFSPEMFTGWGSEGVNVYIIYLYIRTNHNTWIFRVMPMMKL